MLIERFKAHAKSKHICNLHKLTHESKIAKELALPTQTKLFLKNFQRFKKIKIHQHAARQTQQKMTRKLNTDKAYSDTVDRRPAGNRRLAKVAVQCSIDAFVVNQSLVLRINICGENRHLRQAPNRYGSF
jgi:23S rRNA G2445 N2-methylase RlmL